MSGVEERLRDLRRATAERVHPSPALLGRIEASLEPRPPRRWVLRVAIVAVAAAVVAVALGMADAQSIGAPPEAQSVLADVLSHLRAALAQVQVTKDRATSGDVDGAAAAYAAANQEIDQAGAAAARYGATDCQLRGQP